MNQSGIRGELKRSICCSLRLREKPNNALVMNPLHLVSFEPAWWKTSLGEVATMVRIGLQRFAIGIATVLLLLLSAPAIFAQAVAVASINGQVKDPTGSGVAGATVRMVETDKQRARGTTTDAQGRFSLPNLPVGPYQLV